MGFSFQWSGDVPDSVLTESKNIQSLILDAVAKRSLFTQRALPKD
jgi:hypothetical protein